ncbi:carboxypeptidase-like regulatory domain-containing protein [Psychroserpens damuponensis]|uniref:carboxypeptidase-like regulatory domain-containing protein n=1 Tax=Psychroserpens damuponensis TaxID=943936 RepID=UPI00058F3BC5|nr:carboxypeptidase-like regulatory domain-containing protein [Psychroserpens damuponensis]
MIRIKYLLLLIIVLFSSEIAAQTTNIQGKIIAKGDLDRIHIINKTASKFTITNDIGEFTIPTKINDTLIISGVQYVPKEIVITDVIMQTKKVTIHLEDNVNLLDEVVVGKVLTGSLMTDIENSDAKREMNFYDLGIPGYTGPRKTQSERRLYEATTGGGIVPLNPLLNWISGRTKELKAQIAREELSIAIDEAKAKFSKLVFENETYNDMMQNEYFLFCGDDPKFKRLYDLGNDMNTLQFLKDKLEAFKRHLEND